MEEGSCENDDGSEGVSNHKSVGISLPKSVIELEDVSKVDEDLIDEAAINQAVVTYIKELTGVILALEENVVHYPNSIGAFI